MAVTLSQVTASDLLLLADVNRLAYQSETAAQYAFKDWTDKSNMLNFFTAGIQERLSDSNCQVIKAMDAITGEIVGFVCCTLEFGTEGKPELGDTAPTPTAVATKQMSFGLNKDFIMITKANMESPKQHMKDTKHYCGLQLWLSIHQC